MGVRAAFAATAAAGLAFYLWQRRQRRRYLGESREYTETAIASALRRVPAREAPPADATCYVCLDGAERAPLHRDCACRGSSGWAHVECLADAGKANVDNAFLCGMCRSLFQGAVQLRLARALWRAKAGEGRGARLATSMVAGALLQHGETAEALRLMERLAREPTGDAVEGFRVDLQLATAHDEHGDPRRAEALLRSLVGRATAALGAEHPMTLTASATMGAVLNRLGDDAEAAVVIRSTLGAAQHVFPANDPFILFVETTLAHVHENEGRDADAVALYERIIAAQSRKLGPSHPAVSVLTTNMAAALAKIDGRRGDAERLLRGACHQLAAACGPEHPDALYARSKLAWCETHAWDPAELRRNVDWR